MLVLLASAGISGIGLAWKDPDAREELEINWPEDTVVEVLEYVNELSQYSPDPTSVGWASSLSSWVQGSYGQCYHLNAWPVGVTAQTAEAEDDEATKQALRSVAENTEIIAYPMLDGVDPDERTGPRRPRRLPHLRELRAAGRRQGVVRVALRGQHRTDRELLRDGPRSVPADLLRRNRLGRVPEPGHLPGASASAREAPVLSGRDLGQPLRQRRGGQHLLAGVAVHAATVVLRRDDQPSGHWLDEPAEAYDWGYEQLEEAFAEAQDTFG